MIVVMDSNFSESPPLQGGRSCYIGRDLDPVPSIIANP